MTREEFESYIEEYNLKTIYDIIVPSSFDNGWRNYTPSDKYINESGLYGVCKTSDGKWTFYITEYSERGTRPNFYEVYDTENEAIEQLFKVVMKYKVSTDIKRAEGKIISFIEQIKNKKIQNYYSDKINDVEITLEKLDEIINNTFGEKYTYTFLNGLNIMEKQSHMPILRVYGHYPSDGKLNYDIFIPFMYHHDSKLFFNGKELSHEYVTHKIVDDAIYFMYYRDIIKTDLQGNEIWHKHFGYNKENDIYLHSHIFLSTGNWHDDRYPSKQYICVTNGFYSYLLNKENGEMKPLNTFSTN